MTYVPTERDIELAMERYAADAAGGDVEEWKAIEWLWKELPWPVRLMTHLGIALDWWKRKYILPLLCQAASPFLERFSQSEEASCGRGRRWSSFFAPIAIAEPQLFSPELVVFLTEAGEPLFCERAEERVQRHSCPKKPVVEGAERIPQRSTPLFVETKEAARGLVGKLTQLRESVVELSEGTEKIFRCAFPIRDEIRQTVEDIRAFQAELFSSLTALDDGLFHLSDLTFEARCDREAEGIVQGQRELASCIRASLSSFESRAEDLRLRVDEQKNALLARLHSLVRSLDQLSLLDPENPLHGQQSRLVRRAREQIKKFRLSMVKGPGPGISLAELEKFVDKQIGVSEEFLSAGKVSFHQMGG